MARTSVVAVVRVPPPQPCPILASFPGRTSPSRSRSAAPTPGSESYYSFPPRPHECVLVSVSDFFFFFARPCRYIPFANASQFDPYGVTPFLRLVLFSSFGNPHRIALNGVQVITTLLPPPPSHAPTASPRRRRRPRTSRRRGPRWGARRAPRGAPRPAPPGPPPTKAIGTSISPPIIADGDGDGDGDKGKRRAAARRRRPLRVGKKPRSVAGSSAERRSQLAARARR